MLIPQIVWRSEKLFFILKNCDSNFLIDDNCYGFIKNTHFQPNLFQRFGSSMVEYVIGSLEFPHNFGVSKMRNPKNLECCSDKFIENGNILSYLIRIFSWYFLNFSVLKSSDWGFLNPIIGFWSNLPSFCFLLYLQ